MAWPKLNHLDADAETQLAKDLYNGVWDLLEKDQRSGEENEAMVHMAHASRHHWGQVGGPQNWAIGEWQIARVYSELGRGEAAVHHSTLAHAIVTAVKGIDSWCVASVLESMARSHHVAGDAAAAATWRDQAVAALDAIGDPDDRAAIQRDIDSLPF